MYKDAGISCSVAPPRPSKTAENHALYEYIKASDHGSGDGICGSECDEIKKVANIKIGGVETVVRYCQLPLDAKLVRNLISGIML